MEQIIAQNLPPQLQFLARVRRPQLTWRRILIASIIVLLLHLLFFLVIAPRLAFNNAAPSRTEVVEISPDELARMKKKIMKNIDRAPLLKQELHEEYKSKERPDDAQMIAPFNQVVPKQKIAGPQKDAPQEGGGSHAKPQSQSKAQPQPKQLDLSKLGLANKPLPKPAPQAEPQKEQRPEEKAGPRGPPGTHRPVGRDDKRLERGDENLLNAVESEFYSFFLRLEEPLIRNWYFLIRQQERQVMQEMASHRITAGADLPVTIELTIDRSGSFYSVKVTESSGIRSFDELTKEAVLKLGSLPNPPPGLFEGGQYYTRALRFMLHVTETPISSTKPDIYW
jgi:TonB family protein